MLSTCGKGTRYKGERAPSSLQHRYTAPDPGAAIEMRAGSENPDNKYTRHDYKLYSQSLGLDELPLFYGTLTHLIAV